VPPLHSSSPLCSPLCCRPNTIVSDSGTCTAYDGIMQGTCMGSIWFGILSLDMMQQADAAANVVKMSRRNHDEDADLDTDLAAAIDAYFVMYCDDMTIASQDIDEMLEYFIEFEEAMQDGLWGESCRMAKKDCALACATMTEATLRAAAERHGLVGRFSRYVGSDTPAASRGLTIVGIPVGEPEYVSEVVTNFVRANTLEKIERLSILANHRQIRHLLLKYCCVQPALPAPSALPCLPPMLPVFRSQWTPSSLFSLITKNPSKTGGASASLRYPPLLPTKRRYPCAWEAWASRSWAWLMRASLPWSPVSPPLSVCARVPLSAAGSPARTRGKDSKGYSWVADMADEVLSFGGSHAEPLDYLAPLPYQRCQLATPRRLALQHAAAAATTAADATPAEALPAPVLYTSPRPTIADAISGAAGSHTVLCACNEGFAQTLATGAARDALSTRDTKVFDELTTRVIFNPHGQPSSSSAPSPNRPRTSLQN
jgi:hypothetical protein